MFEGLSYPVNYAPAWYNDSKPKGYDSAQRGEFQDKDMFHSACAFDNGRCDVEMAEKPDHVFTIWNELNRLRPSELFLWFDTF